MNAVAALVKANPVRFVAAIQTTLAVAVMLGVPLTPAQLSGIVVAIAAWLSFVTHTQVTPV